MSDKLEIRFGALADPIAEQVPELSAKAAEGFQKSAEAITHLYFDDLLTEGEAHKARTRLMKQITKAVKAARKGK